MRALFIALLILPAIAHAQSPAVPAFVEETNNPVYRLFLR